MDDAVYKVTAFITRRVTNETQLLVFQHPTAGIQLPAGTVETGELAETAVLREITEETGLTQLKIVRHLGRWENELAPGECIIAMPIRPLLSPDPNALPFQKQFSRGITVNDEGKVGAYTKISYIEYDQVPNPTCVAFKITGYVPHDAVRMKKTRDFYHVTCEEETAVRWTHPGDQNHTFTPFWTPLTPKPTLVPGQDKWLNFTYNTLLTEKENKNLNAD
ncbi:MAG: NUDIX domain-containing protein [Chloroflexi bacterium]|nr:NUDIX domain-containing protein [Chloroflexota bacterium]